MHHLDVKRQMDAQDVAAVSELLQLAAAADDHRPLGEHKWLDLVHGGRTGFAGLVAWEHGHDHPVGYAHLTRGRASWALELVVDPHHRDDPAIARDLLSCALAIAGDEGGGPLTLWVPKPTAAHDELAASVGMTTARELLQLRRPLPFGESPTLPTRPFLPGQDEDAWLEVNNLAFAAHPEQGGWDVATLKEREAEPWFDPDGFLLHERGGRLAGYCWTKVHADFRPPLGEIYVMGVHPELQGQGLGRQLLVAGLDHLGRKGLTVAMLYVDAGNAPALRLYEGLGFAVDHVDRAYVTAVAPAPTSAPTA